jgi:alanine dehydrogenase
MTPTSRPGPKCRHPQSDFRCADMVMHVKEPLPPEYDLIREGQIVFTYLHLAADETQTRMH